MPPPPPCRQPRARDLHSLHSQAQRILPLAPANAAMDSGSILDPLLSGAADSASLLRPHPAWPPPCTASRMADPPPHPHPNHSLLVASTIPFVGAASTVGPASLIIGPYSVPFLLPTPASFGHVVSGELYDPSHAALAELDAFEASASPPRQTRPCPLVWFFTFPMTSHSYFL
jgi:hypothetical protein